MGNTKSSCDGQTVANVLRDEFLSDGFIESLSTSSSPVTLSTLEHFIGSRAERLAEELGVDERDVWRDAEQLAIEVLERFELHHAERRERAEE
jgi:hypothetical protein